MENGKCRHTENKDSQINLSASALARFGIVGLIPADGNGLFSREAKLIPEFLRIPT